MGAAIDQLEAYTEQLLNLTAKAHPKRAEEEAIELLTLLIESYEEKRYPAPVAQIAPAQRT